MFSRLGVLNAFVTHDFQLTMGLSGCYPIVCQGRSVMPFCSKHLKPPSLILNSSFHKTVSLSEILFRVYQSNTLLGWGVFFIVICSNMDGPGDYHTKWNKSERERHTIWYHLHVEPKIWHKWTYLRNRNRLSHREATSGCWRWGAMEGWRGEMDWEFRISRCELLYIEWINNKVLLYSTGNYIQYPVIGTSLVVQW